MITPSNERSGYCTAEYHFCKAFLANDTVVTSTNNSKLPRGKRTKLALKIRGSFLAWFVKRDTNHVLPTEAVYLSIHPRGKPTELSLTN